MAHVLVTGGAGFIGSHLVRTLKADGHAVRILDIAEPDQSGVEFVRGSIDDRRVVEDAVDGVDRVYHLAGIAHLWRRDKDDFDRVNRLGTETVLAAAAARKVRRLVHCSTESILLPRRRDGAEPIDERRRLALADMPGPYTRSKFLAENAALRASQNGLDVVVVNPTVPVGDGDRNMTPPAAMLALFLAGRTSFFLDCVLNIADVRDIAGGIALAGERGRSGERYILGGENVPLRDLLTRLGRLSGRPMPRRALPAPFAIAAAQVFGWVADRITGSPPLATPEAVSLALRSAPLNSAKAMRELGYAPRQVDGALTDAVRAFKRQGITGPA